MTIKLPILESENIPTNDNEKAEQMQLRLRNAFKMHAYYHERNKLVNRIREFFRIT